MSRHQWVWIFTILGLGNAYSAFSPVNGVWVANAVLAPLLFSAAYKAYKEGEER